MKRAPHSLLAVAAVALVAGCGDEAPAGSAPGSADKPLVARATDSQAREPGAARTHADASEPGYQKLLKRQSGRPTQRFTPCLVTQAQARAIVGEPIQELQEAPQGPTCLYRTEKGKGLITIAVQNLDFGKLTRQLAQPTRVDVSSRTGFCGQYGQPVLHVRLSRERVLTVAGPCAVAKRFAARAVERLDS